MCWNVLGMIGCVCYVCFFKQKTAYEMRISDWSSDVCSSDLEVAGYAEGPGADDGQEDDDAGDQEGNGRHGDGNSAAASGRVPVGSSIGPVEIGSASGRERVCTYVSISVVDAALNKKSLFCTTNDLPDIDTARI